MVDAENHQVAFCSCSASAFRPGTLQPLGADLLPARGLRRLTKALDSAGAAGVRHDTRPGDPADPGPADGQV